MNKSLIWHWNLPLPLLILASFILDYQQGDLWLANHLYGLEDQQWLWRDSWLLETVIHKGGRLLTGVLVLLAVLMAFATLIFSQLRTYRTGIVYLLVAVIVSLLLVSGLKAVTHVACPWDYQQYGGAQIYFPVYQVIFGDHLGRCFPAGHSSAGYCWLALYFVCRRYFPQWRYYALAVALVFGGVFGIAQQLRGAHFLSHDIWTLVICWYGALIFYRLMLLNKSSNIVANNSSEMILATGDCRG